MAWRSDACLKSVKGIAEGSNLSGDALQVLQDLALRVQDLDALRVRVVAGREVLGDRRGVFSVRKAKD
jgi:hypothetical protein